MKRCPTCQKEFADSMRFCQTDGTPLVEDTAPPDPFKTVVSGNEDILSAIPPPVDPFKTMIGSAPPLKPEEEDDLLQLGEPDPMKTMINPGTFGKNEINFDQIKQDIKKEIPPPISAPKDDLKDFQQSPPSAEPPRFNEPNPPSPSVSNPQPPNAVSNPFESKPPRFDSNPISDKPFNNAPPAAIPSPFDASMPPGYQPPSTPIFSEPEKPKAPEPTFREMPPAPKQNPFEEFQNPPVAQQMQQNEWTPPPAPEAGWQSQNIGANTPFQPPVVGQGDNKTLAVVSLVLGILSIVCCGLLTGIPAIITGYIAKNNVDNNPNQYAGRGMALAGIIMGAISIVLTIVIIILQVVLGSFGRF